jgi:hypothetical protein
MLKIADVTPAIGEGQWWASTKPLGLIRIKYGWSSLDQLESFSIQTWIFGSYPMAEVNYIGSSFLDGGRLLKYSKEIKPSTLKGWIPRTGDVLALPNEALVFTVINEGNPDITGIKVELYADWEVNAATDEDLQYLRLFQRGPLDPQAESDTRFQRILDGE